MYATRGKGVTSRLPLDAFLSNIELDYNKLNSNLGLKFLLAP